MSDYYYQETRKKSRTRKVARLALFVGLIDLALHILQFCIK